MVGESAPGKLGRVIQVRQLGLERDVQLFLRLLSPVPGVVFTL